jgi:hypothetical protein
VPHGGAAAAALCQLRACSVPGLCQDSTAAASCDDKSYELLKGRCFCDVVKLLQGFYSAPGCFFCCCCCCLQDERGERVLAILLSLRQLLAMASQRCALLLRKVDMRASSGSAEEQQLLELLSQMWRGNLPKLTPYREVLIFDKEAQQQPQQ